MKKHALSGLVLLALLSLGLVLNCNDKVVGKSKDATVYKNPEISPEERVDDLLGRMTLAEKVGQMTQVDYEFLQSEGDISKYYLGSILSGGNSEPPDISPGGWAGVYDRFQEEALKTRLGIPLLYGIDAVHGHNNVLGAVVFPHNIGLGATGNPDLVEEVSRITAKEMAGTGVNWTFAPCIAVPRDERWGRTYEGFGESPELVKTLGAAAIRGFQGTYDRTNVLACAKHYIADGGTVNGEDQGDAEMTETELRQIHLPPYISAVEEQVGTIMASYNSWNGEKLHGHDYLLNDVLKQELGFEGFVISDYRAIDQLPGNYKEQIIDAINAGVDMVMVPDRYKEFISNLTEAAEEGSISMSRIDDAVERILRMKFELGVFEHPLTDKTLTASVGSESHRAVGRQAVRESIVLLKNTNNLLPLSGDLARIHVAGKNADDVGNQCGGWTISWQGSSGEVTPGTTILEGIREVASDETEITFTRDGSGADGADIGIVVIGETPYAEFEGDRESLDLDPEDIAAVNRIKSAGIPVVVVLISGRPLIVEPELENWDAFLAAWLPGTEGAGVADVLFGEYDPTGKLPHTWPRTMAQIPVSVEDQGIDPLFPFGFGLSYE